MLVSEKHLNNFIWKLMVVLICLVVYMITLTKKDEKVILSSSVTCQSGGRIFFADTIEGNMTVYNNGSIHYVKEKERLDISITGDCLVTRTF